MKSKQLILLVYLLLIINILVCCSKKSDFVTALRTDREFCSDSLRVIKVVESKMYKEVSSTQDEYVSLFNYFLDHKNEEYDEGISGNLYDMFKTYPSKSTEFEYYLKLLPAYDQNIILKNLTALIYFEFEYVNYGRNREELKALFHSQFPFLTGRQVCDDEFIHLLDENTEI